MIEKKRRNVVEEYLRYSDIDACDRLAMAIENMLSTDPAVRPLDDRKRCGGLLEFSAEESREFIVVGDLHGNNRNLKAILRHEQNIYKIKRNQAVLVILGDAVHFETADRLSEMGSSIAVVDIIVRLINEYPCNVFYLLGNHETFSGRLSKNGVRQGILFRDALRKAKGWRYVELMQEFFDALPVFVKHNGFLAVHAGPARGGCRREEIINVRNRENLLCQLIWNRLKGTRAFSGGQEYSPADLDRLRTKLKCAPDVPIIVGHNPMWSTGRKDSVWIDPLNVKNHVILSSSSGRNCPYISIENFKRLQVKHTMEPPKGS